MVAWGAGVLLTIAAPVIGGGSFEGLVSKLSLTGVLIAVSVPFLATGITAYVQGGRLAGAVLACALIVSVVQWIGEIWRNGGSSDTVIVALVVTGLAALAATFLLLARRPYSPKPSSHLAALTWLSVGAVCVLWVFAALTAGNS